MLRRRGARALMRRVSRPALQLWFEFASTYSYPAVQRIEALADGPGVGVEWKPFLLGPVFKNQGWNDSPFNLYPAKGRYVWRDLERLCAKYGLPFHRPSVFPRPSLLAARVACTAAAEPWCGDFVRAVFHANFAEDRNIASVETVTAILGATTGSRTRSRGRSRQPIAPPIGVDRPDLRQDAHALVGRLEAGPLGTLEAAQRDRVRVRDRRRSVHEPAAEVRCPVRSEIEHDQVVVLEQDRIAVGDGRGQLNPPIAVLDQREPAHHGRRRQKEPFGPCVPDRFDASRHLVLDPLVEDQEPGRRSSFAETLQIDDASEDDPIVVARHRALPPPLPHGTHVHRAIVYALVDGVKGEREDRGRLQERAVGEAAGGQFLVERGDPSG